jgi:ABC-type glycerol-3-phosphate transport system substrate-binding protein
MQKNSNITQTIVLVVFGLGILLGVLFFSGKINLPGAKDDQVGPTGSVVVWGILPFSQMSFFFDTLEQQYKGLSLSYVEKKPELLQRDLVNALASGKGPDVFMIPPGQVAENIDRLYVIPYDSYPKSTFTKNFVDISEQLLTDQGILGIPLFINPMIMFYNRDLFTSAFETAPPTTWDDLDRVTPLITKKNDAGVITQSAVALGTANNITHTKDILSLRLLQKNNPIVTFKDLNWVTTLGENTDLFDVFNWYTAHAQKENPLYSWNQSLPKDVDYFTAGKLGVYFGYPTEIESIRKKNPNLNFAVTMIPQVSKDSKKVVYGELYSIGVSKISKNLPNAVAVASILASAENVPQYLTNTFLVPARRDLLNDRPKNDPDRAMIMNSGIITQSFFDPNADKTNQLFVDAINQINAGTRTPDQIIITIVGGFNDLLDTVEKSLE